MQYVFNKEVLFENITFLLKEQGKKIGELESEAGVSPGYISRTSKEENSRPGIDFIARVSESFNVGIDTLLKVRMREMNSTEKYILSFLEKLYRDTIEGELDWKRESPDSLNYQENDLNGNPMHPLFKYMEISQESESGYPVVVNRNIFLSKAFGTNTYISDDCFKLNINRGVVVYVMSFSKAIHKSGDRNYKGIEVWLNSFGRAEYLCGNAADNKLGFMVENLYAAIAEYAKHPKIDEVFRKAIDLFMKGENDDEDEEDHPFK